MTDTRHRLRAILAADAAGYSRLMSLDDRGTVEALEAARRVFRQCVEEHAGRIVDTAGDSVLAVFETATGAVTAALDIQKTLADSGVGIPEDRRMSFRIGVHMGDVIEKGDGTVYGAGVNIAARLQALAETGGVTVSDAVRALVKGRVAASFVDLGVQRLKNIDEPIQVFKCNVSDTLVPASTARAGIGLKQTIRYCSAPNGMSIAWSTMGRGSPVVWCAMYGHLEQALLTEAARTFFHDLSRQHTLIRYDGIGSGLSDRSVEDPSIERAVADMECVVDAARLDKFTVVAANRGSHGAITFSARHPEKVTRLVLIGAHARGLMRRNPTPEQLARYNALLAAVEAGWSEASPAWRTLYTHSGNSGTTREELLSHAEVNRMSVSAQYMVRYLRAEADADVSEQARTVNCPVLVLHSRGDPTFEEGRRMASLFPDARFVPLNSRNNFIWPSDPVYTEAMGEILNFLSSD